MGKISTGLFKLVGSKATIITLFVILQAFLWTKIGIFSIFIGQKRLPDFEAYLSLSGDIINGINPYTVSHLQTLGPPLVILPYLPFTLVSLKSAKIMVTLGSLVSVYFTCYILAKYLNPKNKLLFFTVLSTLFLTAFPARFTLEMGQIGLYLSLLITFFIVSRNDKFKGFVLSFLISSRLFFATLYISLTKRCRIIFWSLIGISLIFVFSLIFIRFDWYIFYVYEKLLPLLSTITQATNLDYYNQSLRSTLFRIGLGDYYFYVLSGVMITAGYYLYKKQNVLAAIILSILITPISWQHYYSMIFPIFVTTYFFMNKNLKNLSIFFIALFLWWIEFPFLHTTDRNLISGIVASHYFVSGMLLLYLGYSLNITNRRI